MAAPAGRAQGANQVDRALMEAYLARTRTEVAELERRGLSLAGSAFPEVLLVKGVPGPAEQAGGAPLSGADGAALRAALARLGYAEDAWAALATFVRDGGPAEKKAPGAPAEQAGDRAGGAATDDGRATRPDNRVAGGTVGLRGTGWLPAPAEDVALAVETLDPELVVALDGAAARALQTAWGLDGPLRVGETTRVRGRRALNLGGFETALADPDAKRAMWARLKQVPPLSSPL